ncbi:MAG: acylphosphatase [Anaerolineae bacterium]
MSTQENSSQAVPEGTTVAVQLEARVRGTVQGVSFRYYTRRQAVALGLTGFVENRADGGVHVLAQGDRAALLTLLEWLRLGPGLAEVSGVDVQWTTPTVRHAGFEVRY